MCLKFSGLHCLDSETFQAALEEIGVIRTVKIGQAEMCNFSRYIIKQLGSTEYQQKEHT